MKHKDVDVIDFSEDEFLPSKKERKEEKKRKRKRRKKNREFAFVTYLILAMLLLVCINFSYFLLFESEEFISSSYNKRLGAYSKSIIRGDIYSSDGVLLATSKVDSSGNETRSYPQGNKYAHSIGYSTKGMSGVEKDNNFYLLRSHSFILTRLKNDFEGKKNQGDAIVTTLDSKLQDIAYKGLNGKKGAVIAIDPDNGNILSMVSKVDFDPNTIDANWDSLTSDDENSVLINRATQGLYPPGSTFKIITTLAYENEGGNMDDLYDCNGEYSAGGYTIHDYKNTSHGNISFGMAFAKSCNSIFAKIGLTLDKQDLKDTTDKLLFNKKLPTSLSNTNKSRFTLDKNSPEPLVMQTAIGQGDTLVTPLHMCMIASAIANDGVLSKPHIADFVINDKGTRVSKFRNLSYGKIMSEDEANTMKRYMRKVVEEGTGSKLYNKNYEAYAKTGTAEFNANKDAHSWFVGFATENDKKIAIAVIIEGAGAGSEHALPLAMEMFDAYYN